MKRTGIPAWLAGSGVFIAAALSLPLAYLLMRALSYDRAVAVLQRDSTWQVLAGSVALAIVTAVASVLVALPLAWLTERSDLPGRRVWRVLSVVPLVIPSYIGSFALIAVLGPRGADLAGSEVFGDEPVVGQLGFRRAPFAEPIRVALDPHASAIARLVMLKRGDRPLASTGHRSDLRNRLLGQTQ